MLHPVHEGDACPDERQEVCAVEVSPSRLRVATELLSIDSRAAFAPQEIGRRLDPSWTNWTAEAGDPQWGRLTSRIRKWSRWELNPRPLECDSDPEPEEPQF